MNAKSHKEYTHSSSHSHSRSFRSKESSHHHKSHRKRHTHNKSDSSRSSSSSGSSSASDQDTKNLDTLSYSGSISGFIQHASASNNTKKTNTLFRPVAIAPSGRLVQSHHSHHSTNTREKKITKTHNLNTIVYD